MDVQRFDLEVHMKKLLVMILLALVLIGCDEPKLERIGTPQNLRYEDKILFDAVDDATAYVIDLNDEKITITETFYEVTIPGSYIVRVKAQGEGYQDSLYTEEITFTVSYPFSDFAFNYSIRSIVDVPVGSVAEANEIAQVSYSGSPISTTAYTFENRILTLKSTYLTTLTVGEQILTVTTNIGSFQININIFDTSKPYMMSKSEVFTDFSTDVTVIYDLFGGSISGLSGNNITASDYTITNNTVTISKTFIENAFTSEPTRETLVIGYTLESGNNVVIGYIFIKKSTT
jgi:hypothetical protein